MTSPATELQKLIYSTLKARPSVMNLIEGVYDTVPADPFGTKLGYISFGATDMIPDEAECIDGEAHSFQLDIWSRKVGKTHCQDICDAVKLVLHEAELEIGGNNAIAQIRLELQRVMRDPDGVTLHGVMQFAVSIQVL